VTPVVVRLRSRITTVSDVVAVCTHLKCVHSESEMLHVPLSLRMFVRGSQSLR
jgi:hypothetical protein